MLIYVERMLVTFMNWVNGQLNFQNVLLINLT